MQTTLLDSPCAAAAPFAIAHVVWSLDVGGLERLVVELAGAQRTRGHPVFIYCLSHEGALAYDAKQAGIRVVAFQKPRGFSASALCRFAGRVRTDCITVLHTHNAVVHHYAAAAGVLGRVPVIVNTLHGQHPWETDRRLKILYRLASLVTGMTVAVSADARQHHVCSGAIRGVKSTVIANGIGESSFRLSATPGSCRPRLRFGTLARLARVKDHLTLVTAFERVVRRYPAAVLQIGGDGDMRSEIERRVTGLGLREHVEMHGMVTDRTAFLAALDVFVMSSLTEGLPMALLEAMAAGLPIVSTRVGDIPAVAPEGVVAFYCDTSDVDQLAVQMLRMVHADLPLMGAAARRLARGYGIQRTAFEYDGLYQALLSRRAGRPMSGG